MVVFACENQAGILRKYVPDYGINLVDAKDITKQIQFRTDIQVMFEMLQYRQDKQKLLEYIRGHQEYFSRMDYESQQAMATLLHSEKLLEYVGKKDRGEQNMCKALEDWYNEALKIGESQGITQGISQGISQGMEIARKEDIGYTVELLRKFGVSNNNIFQAIAEKYQLSEDEIKGYIQ